ncbi:MAG TPA: alpha/beta hydrolase [Paucimonas sp.]|nr:alpha/beta hydrolase [Paucimonas sp.]
MTSHPRKTTCRTVLAALAATAALGAPPAATAGELDERVFDRRGDQVRYELPDDADDSGTAAFDAHHVRMIRDIAYGSEPEQRFDVYIPQHPNVRQLQGAPVIFMVHGGGWRRGDKAMRSVVENKVKHWAARGFIVVSANYRLLPKAAPIEQAKDVLRALASAQEKAARWGGDRGKFILMGHSAGAHLVALIATSAGTSATRWLGTVALDSAALDVVQIMEERHARLYDEAFGKDPAYWRAASPFHALTKAAQPMLLVCSTRREESCLQADKFADKATKLGVRASVLRQNLSHRDINRRLGDDYGYTKPVEDFMRSLDPVVARQLGGD